MRNTKPPKKSKFPKTNHPAVAESPPEAMIMDQKDASLAEFAAVTADVCRGLHSYLRIVEQNASQKSPTVSHHHSAALQCWAIASTWLLREHANKKIDGINEQSAAYSNARKLH